MKIRFYARNEVKISLEGNIGPLNTNPQSEFQISKRFRFFKKCMKFEIKRVDYCSIPVKTCQTYVIDPPEHESENGLSKFLTVWKLFRV